MYQKVVKRLLDFLLALLLAIPAGLIVGVCCIAVKAESPGPALYVQERPGYKGKIFRLYKLRSMVTETERDGRPLSDMERMTRSGRIIRRLSLDELPQLWNILKGEMSFIGPRPLLARYLSLYTPEQMRRHDVLPGISGWAQVNGRNELTWEEKFDRDVWYADHISFALDCRIFGMTVENVLTHKGINAGADTTMGEFRGSAQEEL